MSVLPINFDTLKRRAKQSIMPLLTPHLLKLRLNTYAPYIGAGIKIDHISLDQGLCVVSMGLTTLNKNIVGTQFGGSLYSMVDPFYMLMLMHQLGSNYVVWDKSSHIDFVAPGNSKVIARMKIPSSEVITIQELAKDGEAVFREYKVDIVDDQQKLIATVTKTLYIRLRKYSKSKEQASRIEPPDNE
jgi:acyl-coenzyme A thioesterase PaaI-like protein